MTFRRVCQSTPQSCRGRGRGK